MKRKAFWSLILVVMLAGIAVHPAWARDNVQEQLERVREANGRFRSIRAVKAAGYSLVPGLDFCFENPPIGGMGFHYINVSLLDNVVNPLKPEAMVYAPGRDGKLRLGAVEYIVPIAGWDAVNTQPPTLFGQTYERNDALGVYSLHAWLWIHNSLGVFSDWNPKVSCKPKGE